MASLDSRRLHPPCVRSAAWALSMCSCLQVSKYEDVQSAAVALVSAAYSRWLENEQRTDDITAIVIVFSDLDSTGPSDA